jgi:hypothetical protein
MLRRKELVSVVKGILVEAAELDPDFAEQLSYNIVDTILRLVMGGGKPDANT